MDGEVKAEIQGADATLGRAPLTLKPNQTYTITVVSFSRTQQSAPSQPCIYTYKASATNSAPITAPIASATPITGSQAAAIAEDSSKVDTKDITNINSESSPQDEENHANSQSSAPDNEKEADDLGNADIWKERKRLFLVLYPYDPDLDSPNNFGDELKLEEGQV